MQKIHVRWWHLLRGASKDIRRGRAHSDVRYGKNRRILQEMEVEAECPKNSVKRLSPSQQEPWPGTEHQFERTVANSWSSSGLYWCYLDRTLSYKHHFTKTAAKLRSRNSLLSKLSGFSWGPKCKRCHSPFFCVSPLLFSRGVLLSSMVQVITYRPIVDVQLNNTMCLLTLPYLTGKACYRLALRPTMCLIIGTLHPTQLE